MNRKGFFAFTVAFLVLLAAIFLYRNFFNEMKEYSKLVDHTREVIISFERLSNHFKSAQMYSDRYSQSTGESIYNFYKNDIDSIAADSAKLHGLVGDNINQQKLLDTLSGLIGTHLRSFRGKNLVEIIQSGQGSRLSNLLTIEEIINRGIEHEKELLAERKLQLDRYTLSTNRLTILFTTFAIALVLITFLASILQITKRKKLEGFLESVLNTSQNGIVTYKAVRTKGNITDFKIEYANEAVEKQLGIKPSAVIGKKLAELPFYILGAEVFEKYKNVVATGKQDQFEHRFTLKAADAWFYIMLARLEDGLTATFYDITEIKKYQFELSTKIAQLESSNSELEQYAYIASHDLQEPLRKIRTYSSYLQVQQGHQLDDAAKLNLGRIMSSAERMANLINDLLNFSSLKDPAPFIETDLNRVLQNVLNDFELLITQKNAVVKHETLPVIDAIPLQMNQLFYNLINNALKFSKTDLPPVIKIGCRVVSTDELTRFDRLDKNRKYYQIIFSDNGIGFREEFSERIFIIFQRLNSSQLYAGSGIGLALCRKIVLNHHGEIYAESGENKGATFYIILPGRQIPDDMLQ